MAGHKGEKGDPGLPGLQGPTGIKGKLCLWLRWRYIPSYLRIISYNSIVWGNIGFR